jgi:hypothetical protein
MPIQVPKHLEWLPRPEPQAQSMALFQLKVFPRSGWRSCAKSWPAFILADPSLILIPKKAKPRIQCSGTGLNILNRIMIRLRDLKCRHLTKSVLEQGHQAGQLLRWRRPVAVDPARCRNRRPDRSRHWPEQEQEDNGYVF